MALRLSNRLRVRSHQKRRLIELLEPKQLLAAGVYISEFVASNDSFLDEDGDDSDWLEVFNGGRESVDLSNWYLTDSSSELDKWQFPQTELMPGEALVVFASDKDRAVAGSQLHTNFKLSAGGEYLALSRDDGGPQFEVISEFSPEYPQQVTDVSYGFTQTVETQKFVTNASDAKVFVPTEEIDPSWKDLTFDDSAWASGVAAIGYQDTIPGFTVRTVKDLAFGFENLTEAAELFEGTGRYESEETRAVLDPQTVSTINFRDPEAGSSGRFRSDTQPFPGDNFFESFLSAEEIAEIVEQGFDLEVLKDDNFFTLRADATFMIPESGLWTFMVNSDDGIEVFIDGESVIREDILTFDAANQVYATVELDAGPHSLELHYFEFAVNASLELAAAKGEFSEFSRDDFALVGDIENGGLEVRTSPDGGDVRLAGFAATDLSAEMPGTATTALLRVPFEVDDPATLETLSLNMRYDDGFVAYLNGQEIAKRNSPDQAGYESTSLVDRLPADAVENQTIDITEHISKLQSGSNLLAIRGLNDAVNSPEFLITAELVQTKIERSELAVFFQQPTPGRANTAAGSLGFLLDDVSISQPHGFYEEAFETEFAAVAGTQIRYTTDGSIPTVENGFDYEEPITVDATTTFRVRSFQDLFEPSDTETVTYLFLDDVVQQSSRPEDWPSSRNGQTLNYGMDPDITESDVWGPQLKEALTQIPTMSIVMETDDFVGVDGIYVNAQSHGRDWERPASLELINPDGSEGFHHDMGIRVRGGFSRSSANPKHAFRLFFRESYGDGSLEFPLFGEEGADEFQKVDLRTSQNYSWAFRGDDRNNFVRDVFSRDIQGQMGQPYTRSNYYHLYINGQYWGLFQTQERAEARYAASYFGGDSDDYDVVKSAGSSGGYVNEATDGNLEAYQRLWAFFQDNGLSDENIESYWEAQGMNPDGSRNSDFERLLDVDNLIDYMIITYYTSDADGPGSRFTRPRVNNYFGIYNREDPDGFKFFEHDSEHSLDTGNAAGANYNLVSPQLGDSVGTNFGWFNPHWMHEQLANNNTAYRERFQDAVYNRLFNDGPLTPENALATLNARASQIDMAIIAESARWGDAQRSNPYTKEDWESAVEETGDWIATRTETVLDQLRDVGWYPENDATPQFSVGGQPQHGGLLLPNDEVSLFSTELMDLETMIPAGSVWRFEDSGQDLGTDWRGTDFDDGSWNSGAGKLAYGENDAVTELSIDPPAATVYFRSTFEVDDPAAYVGGLINLQRDDGAVVYLNGEEVGRSNMPFGETQFDTLALSSVARQEDDFFPLEFHPGLLRQGENTIAVEVHQFRTNTTGDLSFDLELQLGTPNYEKAAAYYTTDGSDPRQLDGQPSPSAIRYEGGALQIPDGGQVSVRLLKGDEWSVVNVASFAVADFQAGDVNQDGRTDSLDIDAVASAVRSNDEGDRFDLNEDEAVDGIDYDFLVDEVLNVARGDIDLNGNVDFSDFLVLSQNFGKRGAVWEDGDANGDGEVSFADFLLISENFGQQRSR